MGEIGQPVRRIVVIPAEEPAPTPEPKRKDPTPERREREPMKVPADG